MEELLARLGGSPAGAKRQADWQERRMAELAQLDGANRTRHVAFWSEMLKDAPPPVPFAQRSRALAPVGFGLNRGQTRASLPYFPPMQATTARCWLPLRGRLSRRPASPNS